MRRGNTKSGHTGNPLTLWYAWELCQCTIAYTGWVFSWGVFFWTLQQLTDEPSLDLYVWLGASAPPLAQRQYCPCWTVTSCCVSRSVSICIRLYYSVITRATIGSLLVKLFACLGRTAGRPSLSRIFATLGLQSSERRRPATNSGAYPCYSK